MGARRLPVRPDLEQLKAEARELLRSFQSGDPAAIGDFTAFHPEPVTAAAAQLADAQLVLARSYDAPSWPRVVQACQLVDAIWRDDTDTVRSLVSKNPHMLQEPALIRKSNWGPPMSYAANLGRDRIIALLHGLGATDLEHAMGRAILQGKVATAKKLYYMMDTPPSLDDALGGPAYTLNVPGTALVFELGGRVRNDEGRMLAPVAVVLESDSRKPAAKHEILEMYVRQGLELPDTPTMALHRGRIDLLEKHFHRDPGLLSRQFTHAEIYPPELGCGDEVQATHGTPLAGATLLHMCVDYDEMAVARWLLEKGMRVDAKAAVDRDGFGGHTALFATVVSQPNFWMNYNSLPQVAPFTRLLLDHRADPNALASLRKQLHPGYGPDELREYRNITPVSWGERFHGRLWVSEPALGMIREAGGKS